MIAILLLFPIGSIAQEGIPAAVEAPQPSAEGAAPLRCDGVDYNICIVAISGATVAAVIAANAITGGALAPVLLAGNGTGLTASVLAGLLVAHLGIDIAMIGAGSAAVATGWADPVVAAASDAYMTAKSNVVTAADTLSTAASGAGTAVGNWLNGE